MDRVFTHLDRDGNGELSLEEFMLMPMSEPQLLDCFVIGKVIIKHKFNKRLESAPDSEYTTQQRGILKLAYSDNIPNENSPLIQSNTNDKKTNKLCCIIM